MERAHQEAEPYAEESVRFRRAAESDRDSLMSLCFAYRQLETQSSDAPDTLRVAIDAALRGDPYVCVFMIELIEASELQRERGVMLVGYVAVTFGFSFAAGGREAVVDELYIEPSAQGHGLGCSALRFAESVCREHGVKRVALRGPRANRRARQLYERLGFSDHDVFLMSKRLDLFDDSDSIR